MAVATLMLLSSTGQAGSASTSPDAEAARTEIRAGFGFVPVFLRALPERALPGLWAEWKAAEGQTALTSKMKELIAVAVAAQIPCSYCVYAHTEFAKLEGARAEELGEAVALASLTRHWSTFLNGIQLDEASFRGEVRQIVDHVKAGAPAQPVAVVDGKSALEDARQIFGIVPEFVRRFPEWGRAAAWRTLKDVELSDSALPGKHKSLIGVAVAAQIPCKYCLIIDTEFARIEGASQQEIDEVIVIAGQVRQWSTLMHGLQVDPAALRRDIDRLVNAARRAKSRPAPATSPQGGAAVKR